MKVYLASPSSSPPTPPSPLPVSVGPGNYRYPFSPSPSPSPPFSPPSGFSSPEASPLLRARWPEPDRPKVPSAFSLDMYVEDSCPPPPRLWLLKRCLAWLMLRCCCFCSSSLL